MTEQKIQRTLWIKDGLQYWEYADVWQALGDNAALYGDNGGDADGDTLLPVIPLDEGDEGVQAVLDAGYGEMVKRYTLVRAKLRLEAWDDETALPGWTTPRMTRFTKPHKGSSPTSPTVGPGSSAARSSCIACSIGDGCVYRAG